MTLKSLLILHMKNKDAIEKLDDYLFHDILQQSDYNTLKKMLDEEAHLIETGLYSHIDIENDISGHFRSIACMIAVLYVFGLASIIHSWII